MSAANSPVLDRVALATLILAWVLLLGRLASETSVAGRIESCHAVPGTGAALYEVRLLPALPLRPVVLVGKSDDLPKRGFVVAQGITYQVAGQRYLAARDFRCADPPEAVVARWIESCGATRLARVDPRIPMTLLALGIMWLGWRHAAMARGLLVGLLASMGIGAGLALAELQGLLTVTRPAAALLMAAAGVLAMRVALRQQGQVGRVVTRVAITTSVFLIVGELDAASDLTKRLTMIIAAIAIVPAPASGALIVGVALVVQAWDLTGLLPVAALLSGILANERAEEGG